MDKDYNAFLKKVKGKLNIDLTLYKEAQMKRRLSSLRDKRGYSNFQTYYQALDKDPQLLTEFIERLTINVSEFLRNPKRWDVLRDKVIPNLLQTTDTLKIWSAACSTGEEPYSLALLMHAYFPKVNYTILATDIDKKVLEQANQGVYQQKALKELSPEHIETYFTNKNGLYTVKSHLKKNITFKRHNLLSDPYPKNVDLIVCRNVLIYFTDDAKEVIYANFSNALKQTGILFVGSTEQIFQPLTYDLSVFDTFFYQKSKSGERLD